MFGNGHSIFRVCRRSKWNRSKSRLTSDAGLLPLRQLDQHLGLTAGFADQLTDRRHSVSVRHTLPEMVRSRVFGILAGYADQNDHDALRRDGLFQARGRPLADRRGLGQSAHAVAV